MSSLNENATEKKEENVKPAPISTSKEKELKKVDKKKKEKKPSRIVKSFKETKSELKKVTWPKFNEVTKKTGVVLVVVLVFAVVLCLIYYLLGLLFGLLNA